MQCLFLVPLCFYVVTTSETFLFYPRTQNSWTYSQEKNLPLQCSPKASSVAGWCFGNEQFLVLTSKNQPKQKPYSALNPARKDIIALSWEELHSGSLRDSYLPLRAASSATKSRQSRKAGVLFIPYVGILHGEQGSSMKVRAEMDSEESPCPPPLTMGGCQEVWCICKYHHCAK